MGLPKHHRQPPQPQQPPRGVHPPNKGRHGAGGQGQGPPLAPPVAGAAGGGDKQGHKARPPMAAFKRPFRG